MKTRMKRGLRRPLLACILLATMLPIGTFRPAAADSPGFDSEYCELKGTFSWIYIPVGDPGLFGLQRVFRHVHVNGLGTCFFGELEYDLRLDGGGYVAKLGECSGDIRISGLKLRVTINRATQAPVRTVWRQSKSVPFPGGTPIVGTIEYQPGDYPDGSTVANTFSIVTRSGGKCPPEGKNQADITLSHMVP